MENYYCRELELKNPKDLLRQTSAIVTRRRPFVTRGSDQKLVRNDGAIQNASFYNENMRPSVQNDEVKKHVPSHSRPETDRGEAT